MAIFGNDTRAVGASDWTVKLCPETTRTTGVLFDGPIVTGWPLVIDNDFQRDRQ